MGYSVSVRPDQSRHQLREHQGARDTNLKSVRLDRDWRGIVFKPSSGDVYVLLYVDHHDAAYRWAENRKLAVNPITGAMQMVVLESVTETEAAPAPVLGQSHAATVSGVQAPLPREADEALFAQFGDRELLSLGVPEDSLTAGTDAGL